MSFFLVYGVKLAPDWINGWINLCPQFIILRSNVLVSVRGQIVLISSRFHCDDLCRFEMMLYKLELLDHLRRLQREKERPGLFLFEHGIPVPVVISKEEGVEVFSLAMNALFIFPR